MTNTLKKEIVVALLMLGIAGMCLFLHLHPMMYIGIHVAALALFTLFAFSIWRSQAKDERAAEHKTIASDIGFTVGGFLLGAGMIYQLIHTHDIDPWLMATLGAMVITRVITHVWLNKYH